MYNFRIKSVIYKWSIEMPYLYQGLKACLHNQSFPSKAWFKFSLTKFFDRVNLHQKLCQRTLME